MTAALTSSDRRRPLTPPPVTAAKHATLPPNADTVSFAPQRTSLHQPGLPCCISPLHADTTSVTSQRIPLHRQRCPVASPLSTSTLTPSPCSAAAASPANAHHRLTGQRTPLPHGPAHATTSRASTFVSHPLSLAPSRHPIVITSRYVASGVTLALSGMPLLVPPLPRPLRCSF
ncbi:uncharacterized protein LOC122055091 [Zingiber officinale]|uniref:uncharacterized protein LOC122055091 n=1 Tax=Zingiber officinale TaxID=94328 RepID=UPI001C4ACBAB|nr:uncharacterized protein LOC122055091 [Zingiber officinale]